MCLGTQLTGDRGPKAGLNTFGKIKILALVSIEPRFHSSSVRTAVTTPAEIYLPPGTDDSKPRTEVTKVTISYTKFHRNGLQQFLNFFFWRPGGGMEASCWCVNVLTT